MLAISGTSYAIKRTYDRVENILNDRAISIENGTQTFGVNTLQLRLDLITDAWSMVDMAHRLRQCLKAMPGLRVGPNISEFKSHLSRTEGFRHHFQHLANLGRLSKKESVWGGVGWFLSLKGEEFPFAKGEMFVMPLPAGEAITVFQTDEDTFFRKGSKIANFTLTLVNSQPVNLTFIALKLSDLEVELEESFRNLKPDKLTA